MQIFLKKSLLLGFILIFTFVPFFLSFAQTSDVVDINLTVESGSTGGGGGPDDPPPSEDISGCTDPLALNYNSLATIDDGSCNYVDEEIPNVLNFTATYNESSEQAELSWQNPSFPEFLRVRIVRKEDSLPVDPFDGVLVYSGTGQSTDNDILFNVDYFYTAFVENDSNDFSSGAIASLFVEGEEEPPIEPPVDPEDPDPDPDTDPDSDPDPDTRPDPFESFPEVISTDPKIQALSIFDFEFLQTGERPQIFKENGINIRGEKEITIRLAYDKVPETLKTIGISILHPSDENKVFSFLLKPNEDKTYYIARIAPLSLSGQYPITIYVFNFQDQTIKKMTSRLVVAGASFERTPTEAVVQDVLVPLSVLSGITAGVVQGLLVTGTVISFSDLYLLFLRAIGALLGLLGIRKRHKPWGTVYDAVTKRPIDPAYVTVMESKKPDDEVSSAITDIDGRYGFFLPAGSYVIKAGKTHYKFPSQTLSGKDKDELYNNLYFGEEISTGGGEVINRNIPLDPIGFDWNEFTKSKTSFFQVYSKKEARRDRIFNIVYGLGFILALASTTLSPSWLNIFVVFIYISIFVGQKVWKSKHKVVSVKRDNGEPIPFSIIRFYIAGLDQEVKHVVTDHLGRFYALLRPGEYYYTVEEKMPDSSYKLIYKSDPIKLKKGVLVKDVIV